MARGSRDLARILAKLDKVSTAPREKMTAALLTSGNELASAQKMLAESSRDTGDLIDSITVTAPGQSTPPYSQPGGSRVAGEMEVLVTAGNEQTRYVHLVEFGTSKADPQPFFWPAYRLLKKRLKGRIDRAGRKAIRDAWSGK